MRKKFIYVLWALLILGILSVAAVFTAIAKGWIGYVPPVEELENPNLKFATQIISDDGQLLGTWSYSKENRVYVGYNDLSPNLVHALVATEDVRFSEHSGIDARAFMRAVIKRGIFMQKHASAVGKTILFAGSRQCNGTLVAKTDRMGYCCQAGTLLYKRRNSDYVP